MMMKREKIIGGMITVLVVLFDENASCNYCTIPRRYKQVSSGNLPLPLYVIISVAFLFETEFYFPWSWSSYHSSWFSFFEIKFQLFKASAAVGPPFLPTGALFYLFQNITARWNLDQSF